MGAFWHCKPAVYLSFRNEVGLSAAALTISFSSHNGRSCRLFFPHTRLHLGLVYKMRYFSHLLATDSKFKRCKRRREEHNLRSTEINETEEMDRGRDRLTILSLILSVRDNTVDMIHIWRYEESDESAASGEALSWAHHERVCPASRLWFVHCTVVHVQILNHNTVSSLCRRKFRNKL